MNTAFLSALFLWIAICFGDTHDHEELTVTLLETYLLPDETDFNSSGTESVEYDPDNNVWYFVDWGIEGEVGTISGDYPVSSTDPDVQYLDNPIGSASSGMVYLDGYLYVANLGTGNLTQISTTTGAITKTVNVYPGLNGLCYDPANINMLYGTAVGVDFTTFTYVNEGAGLWSINTDDWTVTRLYDGSNSPISDDYIYHPNGCIVNDGVVYMVETRIDGTGAFGMYNIETMEFTYDNTVVNTMGDGIVYVEPYFFMTAWFSGQLLAMNTDETNSTFEVVLSGLGSGDGSNGAADLCIGPDNVLAIPNQGQTNIYFVQFELPHTTPTPTEDESKGVKLMFITNFALIMAMIANIL